MLTTYRDGRWLLMFSDDEERDESTLTAMIHKATGRPDLGIDIITTGRWELSALIAKRFTSGRVFLAGDAAHALPPARGGYGRTPASRMPTTSPGSWQPCSPAHPRPISSLPMTRNASRSPGCGTGRSSRDLTMCRFARPADTRVPIIDDEAMELGQLYRSAAVLGAGEDLPPALRPDQWNRATWNARSPCVGLRGRGTSIDARSRTAGLDVDDPGSTLVRNSGAGKRACRNRGALQADRRLGGTACTGHRRLGPRPTDQADHRRSGGQGGAPRQLAPGHDSRRLRDLQINEPASSSRHCRRGNSPTKRSRRQRQSWQQSPRMGRCSTRSTLMPSLQPSGLVRLAHR